MRRIDTPKSAEDVVASWGVTSMDAHAAAWAFATDWHGGQWSDLYEVLCMVERDFKPGPLMSSGDVEHDPDDEWTNAHAVYHEAAAHKTEREQADFLRRVLALTTHKE